MVPLPWSYVRSWRCTGCGICCVHYQVVLKFDEWLRIVHKFGVAVTGSGLNKLYLGKKPDGSCIFLTKAAGMHLCGLQDMKPTACKLWPFKIMRKPRYGRSREAIFNYRGERFYVYIDPSCPEIIWGRPTRLITEKVIPEFIEIALGTREKQVYSTGALIPNLQIKRRFSRRPLI
ncbi:MAG: Fe-S-cluster oxidoreductase [Candidatus Bathyarchaeota archaeon B63]|nr:MAG: Fe-S-cluster oxidoreductase [Candidatus Bathyarchaeota archaeon B63]